MRRKLTPSRVYGSGRLVIISFHATRDLCELLALSAEQSGRTRSAEINYLLRLALNLPLAVEATCPPAPVSPDPPARDGWGELRHRISRSGVGGPKSRVDVRMTPELRAVIDASASRRHLSRSAEINRLLRIALAQDAPLDPPNASGPRPLRAHIV